PSPIAAVGRRNAARRHRACARQSARAPPGGRTDRRAGRGHGGTDRRSIRSCARGRYRPGGGHAQSAARRPRPAAVDDEAGERGGGVMMMRLAWRSLATRPVRAAVLAAGFGFGIAVMVELLGVGDVILQQAHAPALSGGGDLFFYGPFGPVTSARL